MEEKMINAYNVHPILKEFYYSLFKKVERSKEIDLMKIQLLIGPGGVGKTFSSEASKQILKYVNIKIEIVNLNLLEDIDVDKLSNGDFDVIIFDSFNEAKDQEKIFGSIQKLIDNKKLIIINSRENNYLSKMLTDGFLINKNIFKLNYKRRFYNFFDENRYLNYSSNKYKLWEVVKLIYGPEISEINFESNLRFLRLLFECLNKYKINNNGDFVIKIRDLVEKFIRDENGGMEVWKNFKNKIPEIIDNKFNFNDLDDNIKKTLIELDLFRYNNDIFEIRDFNLIDHFISTKILSSIDKRDPIDKRIEKGLRISRSIENYSSSFLDSFIVYQIIFRDKDEIDLNYFCNKYINEDWFSKTVSLLKTSGILFNESKFIILQELSHSNFITLASFSHVIFAEILITDYNDFESDIYHETRRQTSNDIFHLNMINNLIILRLRNNIDKQWLRQYINSYLSGIQDYHAYAKTLNNIVLNILNKTNLATGKISFNWWRNVEHYEYSLLLILKNIQYFLLIKGVEFEIPDFSTNINIRSTTTYINRNCWVISKNKYNSLDCNVDECHSSFSPKWSLELLSDISNISNSPDDYHTNETFLEIVKDFSNGYPDVTDRFNYYTKFRYLKHDGYLSKFFIGDLLKFDLWLYKNKKYFKTVQLKAAKNTPELNIFVPGDLIDSGEPYSNDDAELEKMYFSSKSTLPQEFMNLWNSFLLFSEDNKIRIKQTELLVKQIIKHNIIAIHSMWTTDAIDSINSNTKTFSHNLIRMKNEFVKNLDIYDSRILSPESLSHYFLERNINDVYYDGNKTLFLIDNSPNTPKTLSFYIENKFSKHYKSSTTFPANIQWQSVSFIIENQKLIKAQIHIDENNAVEFNGTDWKEVEYDSTVSYID